MLILPLQWEKHSGPDAVGTHKFTFALDESIGIDFNPLLTAKKGTQFIVMMVETGTIEAEQLAQETPELTKERFRKRMNALISQISDLKGEHPTEYRESVKAKLKERGWIETSTKDLTLDNLAAVIVELEKVRKHYDSKR
jgi:hypothetical protein